MGRRYKDQAANCILVSYKSRLSRIGLNSILLTAQIGSDDQRGFSNRNLARTAAGHWLQPT